VSTGSSYAVRAWLGVLGCSAAGAEATDGGQLFQLNVKQSARSLLRELDRRGLVVKMETVDAKRNARHWHVGFDKRPGVLEITDLGDTCELKVAANRDGGWATALARELVGPHNAATS
jgi:hypothetical protein